MKRDQDAYDDRPTRAECERDEQGRRPAKVDPAYQEMLRRTDPWNPENIVGPGHQHSPWCPDPNASPAHCPGGRRG